MPNGLIIQWGVSIGGSSITFPIKYKENPFFICTPVNNNNANIMMSTFVYSLTAETANTITYYSTGSSIASYQTGTIMWLAIGY